MEDTKKRKQNGDGHKTTKTENTNQISEKNEYTAKQYTTTQ